MKVVYTKHALEKFKHPSVVKLGITKIHIQNALEEPDKSWVDEEGLEYLLRKIDEKHNLRIVYRKEDDIIIITFHPAKRGRYEK